MDAKVTTNEILDWTVGKFTNDALEQAVGVGFKDEDEDDDGRRIGPIWLELPSGKQEKAPSWYPVKAARALAEQLGVPLREW